MKLVDRWKERARAIRRDTYTLYFACRDPNTPWYAKALAAAVVAYALSPIDLIPDFVPVLGYLDDFILLPLGILLAVRLVPAPVMAACRERAAAQLERPTNWAASIVIVGVWLLVAAAALYLLNRRLDLI